MVGGTPNNPIRSAPFQPIDDRQHTADFQTKRFGLVDGCERTAAGGDDIFDNYHFLAWRDGTFDIAARAVLLGFFADDEALDSFTLATSDCDDGSGDRIGADGHATDCSREWIAE